MANSLHLTGSFDTPLVVPLGVQSFEAFRAWTLSDDFPESGRIDYVNGKIDFDRSPEKFFSHGTLKAAILLPINYLIDYEELGYLLIDQSRVVHEAVKLSAEPDIAFVSYEAIETGRVHLTESKSDPEDYVEIVGAPDLVCEIVSDSSVKKDTVELFAAYYEAGVLEYWLADARRGVLHFTIYQRGADAYVATPVDEDGFAKSTVLERSYRLTRGEDRNNMPKFRLEEK